MCDRRLVLRRAHARRRGGLVPRRLHGRGGVGARARAQPAPAVPPARALRDILRPEEEAMTRCLTGRFWKVSGVTVCLVSMYRGMLGIELSADLISVMRKFAVKFLNVSCSRDGSAME